MVWYANTLILTYTSTIECNMKWQVCLVVESFLQNKDGHCWKVRSEEEEKSEVMLKLNVWVKIAGGAGATDAVIH